MSLLRNHIAVALDQMTTTEALEFVRETKNELGFYKVGLELFYLGGKEFIHELSKENIKIFLDLKLHDIPTTVSKSIQSLKDLKVDYLTLHLTGGKQMLKAARLAQEEYMPTTKLLGVSYLTSHDQEELQSIFDIKNSLEKESSFCKLFDMATEENIYGVVHSGEELPLAFNYSFTSVCPGIRFLDEIETSQTQDQKRVFDPKSAFNFKTKEKNIILVIGRSLTKCSLRERKDRILYLKNLLSFDALN